MRTLLLAVLLLGIIFGSIGRILSNARQQRIAASGVRELGGQVGQMWRTSFIPPDWLLSICGAEVFMTTVKVEVDNRRLTDKDLAQLCYHLSHLPDLEIVNIHNAAITDSGLEPLGRLRLPGGLGIFSCPITDDGLTHLKKLNSSQEMWLVETGVTERGAAQLADALPECAILYDSDGKISRDQEQDHLKRRGIYRGAAGGPPDSSVPGGSADRRIAPGG